MPTNLIRIATRKSKLALWQARFVKSALEKKYPEISAHLVEIVTIGDQHQTNAHIPGKSVFVKALQDALLKNEADIAVHSVKDMSVYPTEELTLAAILKRDDARDVFVSSRFTHFDALPIHAVIGSSSPRRTAFLKSQRPDLQIKLLRGNVDTRIRKLEMKEYDAIILAAAGLKRLDLTDWIRHYFSLDEFVPAIGQGAIGIECRAHDQKTREMVSFLNHIETEQCVMAERAVNQILGGDCYTPIGAHAIITQDQLFLRAMIGNVDGSVILTSQASGDACFPHVVGECVAQDLIKQGAKRILR